MVGLDNNNRFIIATCIQFIFDTSLPRSINQLMIIDYPIIMQNTAVILLILVILVRVLMGGQLGSYFRLYSLCVSICLIVRVLLFFGVWWSGFEL